MILTGHDAALLRVAKANKKMLVQFREGIHLATSTARTIEDLQSQVCSDRLTLADSLVLTGNKLMKTRPAEYRSAISRFYYSMYHAARAVVYFKYDGDDHQEHSALPAKLPDDFPDTAVWQNALKDARGYRNDADYDPYPAALVSWRDIAKSLQGDAPRFAVIARTYLRGNGCGYV